MYIDINLWRRIENERLGYQYCGRGFNINQYHSKSCISLAMKNPDLLHRRSQDMQAHVAPHVEPGNTR